MSAPEDALAWQIKAAGLPSPKREYRFHPERRWRFDFAWPMSEKSVAVEVEGGTWVGGRHVSGAGFARDAEKYNAAAMQGWIVLRVTPQQVNNGQALALIEDTLTGPR